MKILGSIIANLLPVMILGTTLVLFISLPIRPTEDLTLGGSIFGHLELLKEKDAK